MKILYVWIALLVIGCRNTGDTKNDIAEIKAVMAAQEKAWNEKDLEAFMAGYWRSEDLKFFGTKGLNKGWQKTLDGYKERYPTAEHTGTLAFTLVDITPIEKDSYWVMGRFHLKRSMGNAEGNFMVIFRRINGKLLIVADSSC